MRLVIASLLMRKKLWFWHIETSRL